MKLASIYPAILSLSLLLAAGCGNGGTPIAPVNPAACVPATHPEFAYVLTGYAVSMFTVDSCTGQFTPSTPASVSTGYAFPQAGAEQMVVDPLGRFAYVANLVSNATNQSTISMFRIDATTGVLTAASPATVGTGFFPQGIAIDPLGRFVYTVNTDDSSVSMFTINQSTGVLTPTTPASVSTFIPGQLLSDPTFLTVDPAGRFLYVASSNSEDATVLMFGIDQNTGVLTATTPAAVGTSGLPFQVAVAPNGKFAYVVNNFAGDGVTIAVSQYTVNSSTGVLTESASFGLAAGNQPTAIAVDPTSRFAYVVNRFDNSLAMYTIDSSTGNLTLNATASNPNAIIATGTQPFRADFDPSGKFLYVTNEASAASIYSVNSDGTLKSLGVTGVATGGLSIAFRAGSN